MAPTMEPSEQNAMGYAQLYVLDPEWALLLRRAGSPRGERRAGPRQPDVRLPPLLTPRRQ